MGTCFLAIILSTMFNAFKLLLKFINETYSLSVWYNRISLLPPKKCAEATFLTEADWYSAYATTIPSLSFFQLYQEYNNTHVNIILLKIYMIFKKHMILDQEQTF